MEIPAELESQIDEVIGRSSLSSIALAGCFPLSASCARIIGKPAPPRKGAWVQRLTLLDKVLDKQQPWS